MTYHGIVTNGVVVLEGEKPSEGTRVEVIPVGQKASAFGGFEGLGTHAAIGIWKDRSDLPADPIDASKVLRQRLMRRTDE